MVRAGDGGNRFDQLLTLGLVSIGCAPMRDMTNLHSRQDFVMRATQAFPQATASWIRLYAGQAYRFVRAVKCGDAVLTYSTSKHAYLVGSVVSEYVYDPLQCAEEPNLREVLWTGRIPRDQLCARSRRKLSSMSKLFQVEAATAAELDQVAAASCPLPFRIRDIATDTEDEADAAFIEAQTSAFGHTRQRVARLDPKKRSRMAARLAQAMAEDLAVTPAFARRTLSFNAASTGDVATILEQPVWRRTPVLDPDDIDGLVRCLLANYERLDVETRRLVPLRKMYWPV